MANSQLREVFSAMANSQGLDTEAAGRQPGSRVARDTPRQATCQPFPVLPSLPQPSLSMLIGSVPAKSGRRFPVPQVLDTKYLSLSVLSTTFGHVVIVESEACVAPQLHWSRGFV